MGLAFTAVLAVLGTTRVALLVAVLAMGIAHEIGDGDFLRGEWWPLEWGARRPGISPGATVYLGVHL